MIPTIPLQRTNLRRASVSGFVGHFKKRRDTRNTSIGYKMAEILLTLWMAQIGKVESVYTKERDYAATYD